MITALPRIAIAVHDFPAAVATFRDVFGMPVVDFSDRTVPSLGAHVAMCVPEGGSNVELMAPSDPAAPLSLALQKFLDRRGDGLYAMMLEAPDPNAEAVELAERGLDVLPLMPGAGGRDIHPRSTHGVLVRVYPNDSAATGGGHVSQEPNVSGIVRAVIATTDAVSAAAAYTHGFGLQPGPTVKDPERGVCSVTCIPPKGGVVELVSVIDPSKAFARDVAAFVERRGEGLFALVLRAADPAAAMATLTERGVAPAVTEVPMLDVFGAQILITA